MKIENFETEQVGLALPHTQKPRKEIIPQIQNKTKELKKEIMPRIQKKKENYHETNKQILIIICIGIGWLLFR